MQCCSRKKSSGYGQIGWSSSRRPFLLWKDYLATTSSGFTRKTQERVFCRKSSDENVHEIKLLKGSVAAFDPIVRPRRILPGGLTMDRQGYLYSRVQPFVQNPWKDVTCTCPNRKMIDLCLTPLYWNLTKIWRIYILWQHIVWFYFFTNVHTYVEVSF